MPEEQQQTQVREATSVASLKTAELATLFPPKTGALLPEGTAIRIFSSAKDMPRENEQMAKENAKKVLKITKSKEDINAGYAYLQRLKLFKEMIEGAQDLATLRQRTKERREQVGKVFQENMAAVFTKQRVLEKTYRELDAFFYEARLNQGEPVAYVSIVNASADKNFDELMNPETGLASRLPHRDNFDMRNLTGLIVAPEWPGNEARVSKYGELAQQCMAHFFCGFPEVDIKKAHEWFDVGGDLQDLKSTDPVKQHVSVIANPLRIRRANRYEGGLGDLFISPTGIFGGKVYKGDVTKGIHVAQANKEFKVLLPTPDGSPLEMKWNVRGGQEMKFNKALIPLALYEGIVFWGVDTLYASSSPEDQGMDQYTVKRCDEYVAKVVLHFLNGRTFIPNEQKARDDIRSAINRFLMANTGTGKMLEEGQVMAVETVTNPDGSLNNQAIDIKIKVKYKNALRQLNMYLVTSDSQFWKEGKK
ncbi:MAG: hypothetical protein EPO24_03250 [Bacteroidetes bacterium]|nr:MAG: hypothetical protein EPO24_03250 [Bacteroidota bacterium]